MSVKIKIKNVLDRARADKRWGVLALILVVHLGLVVIVATESTMYSYSKFYGGELPQNALYPRLDRIANQDVVKPYLEFGGINRGYGFFAPNVLSSGRLVFTIDGREVGPAFRTREGANRYNTLCTKFVSQAVSPKMRSDTSVVLGQFPSFWKLDSVYNDLLLKNIAAHILTRFPGTDSIAASLLLYDYPTLKQYREGQQSPKYYLLYRKLFARHP